MTIFFMREWEFREKVEESLKREREGGRSSERKRERVNHLLFSILTVRG